MPSSYVNKNIRLPIRFIKKIISPQVKQPLNNACGRKKCSSTFPHPQPPTAIVYLSKHAQNEGATRLKVGNQTFNQKSVPCTKGALVFLKDESEPRQPRRAERECTVHFHFPGHSSDFSCFGTKASLIRSPRRQPPRFTADFHADKPLDSAEIRVEKFPKESAAFSRFPAPAPAKAL